MLNKTCDTLFSYDDVLGVIPSNDISLDSNYLSHNYDLSKLKLSSKQINRLKKRSYQEYEDFKFSGTFYFPSNLKLGKANVLSRIDANHTYLSKEDFYNVKYNIAVYNMKQKYFELIKTYYSSFNSHINKIPKLKTALASLQAQGQDKKGSSRYEDYKKIRQQYRFVRDNSFYAKNYKNIFDRTGVFKYLERSVALLDSAIGKYSTLKCNDCGYREGSYRYTSNDRFDSFSNDKKMKMKRGYLTNSIRYLGQLGYTYTVLMFSVKNLDYDSFTKDNIKNFSKLKKEFFRYKFTEGDIIDFKSKHTKKIRNKKGEVIRDTGKYYRVNALEWQHLIGMKIEDIYKGYFSVLEISHSTDKGFHPHSHDLVIRDKPKNQFDKTTGKIPQAYLSKAWANVCNKFGVDEFKGSEVLYVQSNAVKNYYNDKDFNIASYILQYITKGVSVEDEFGLQKVIQETDGIRFDRGGGLLSSRAQKRYHTVMELMSYYRKGKRLSCSLGVLKSLTYKEVKSNLGKKDCSCGFCGGQLFFDGISIDDITTDLTDPFKLNECVLNLGLKQKIII